MTEPAETVAPAPDGKRMAILTYIDATENMVQEFGWLYRSWIYSGNWRTSDIVAVCHPGVESYLPKEPGIITIPRVPHTATDARWADYPFINSIACLSGEHTAWLPERYSHILRSDADVFLTHNLVEFRPNLFVFGRGRYAQVPEVREKIAQFAAKHGVGHHGVFNCGSSMLGPAAETLSFLYNQTIVCNWLWEEFKDDPGKWPGWARNTLTMYAAEIVANHYFDTYLYNAFLHVLDFESYRDDVIQGSGIHAIHAVPGTAYWSKFEYRAGAYAGASIADLDRTKVSEYCHWLTEVSTDQVKEMAGY